VTHDDELIRRAVALGPFKLIPRGLERFAALIRGTGFTIAHVERSGPAQGDVGPVLID
jgi:hypothetical protein